MKKEITYYGHSTIILTTCKGKRLIIDPFLQGNPSCPNELKDPTHIDYIGLTHGHSDHTSDAVILAKNFGAIVFATFELASLLVQDGVPENNIQYMNKGGRIKLPGSDNLFVNLTHALHSNSYQTSDGKSHYAGEACGIVVELEDGTTIYHAGDTSLFSDMEDIRERYKPEVVLLPIGDRYTMGPIDAAKAVELLKPKTVIPIHWGTFSQLTGSPEEFKAYLKNSETNVVILIPGEKFKFDV